MNNSILSLLNRSDGLFTGDIKNHALGLNNLVSQSRFLVLGGAGSIGMAVSKEIFKRNPLKLHVVDISENNLVELVRDIRSSEGYIDGDFKTFALDIGSWQYDAFIESDGNYDYVLNLSALKHVRSEKDPFTLMRMIELNIFNTEKTVIQSTNKGSKKYFAVSTDKAANPVNMMGASKRLMEMFLFKRSEQIDISTARFANVAFSDGSLLHGFNQRLLKSQPIVAPSDVRRYFVTPQESGELCLMSCVYGENRDIFFPKLMESLHLTTFSEIAIKYLEQRGFTAYECETEEEARRSVKELSRKGAWPCLFSLSNTTGEKSFEEFFTEEETLEMGRFENIGIVKNGLDFGADTLADFRDSIERFRNSGKWTKKELVDLFQNALPQFKHEEKGKFLDDKM